MFVNESNKVLPTISSTLLAILRFSILETIASKPHGNLRHRVLDVSTVECRPIAEKARRAAEYPTLMATYRVIVSGTHLFPTQDIEHSADDDAELSTKASMIPNTS